MSSYSELIKNFEKIRSYMRDFYVYGFKNRGDYDAKSARSYDDERRRIESWLGDYMGFIRTAEGKNIFISIDSRSTQHNPLYKAWKSKTFTDGDITLHFIIFDILYASNLFLTLNEIIEIIDKNYLSRFKNPFSFDESTLRKKLKEYQNEGIIVTKKEGKKTLYARAEENVVFFNKEALDFYSEIAPCGVIGSYLLDKQPLDKSNFCFKHHYVTGTLDANVLAQLFSAMQQQSYVTVINRAVKNRQIKKRKILPLKIFISAQNGRQYLLAYAPDQKSIQSFRVDYLSQVELCEKEECFNEYRQKLAHIQNKMWGVNSKISSYGKEYTERVQFDVRIGKKQAYVVKRLMREKRIGEVVKLDDETYRFTAELYDSSEIIPWVRTFIGKIIRLNFSNRTVENQLKADLYKTYEIYGIKGDEL